MCVSILLVEVKTNDYLIWVFSFEDTLAIWRYIQLLYNIFLNIECFIFNLALVEHLLVGKFALTGRESARDGEDFPYKFIIRKKPWSPI